MRENSIQRLWGALAGAAFPRSRTARIALWHKHRRAAAKASRRRDVAEIEGHLRKALQVGRELGETEPWLSLSLQELAAYFESVGTYSQAQPLYAEAVEVRERILGPEHFDVAASINDLALLYYTTGKYSEAAELYERLLPLLEKIKGAQDKEVAVCLENYAALLRKLERPGESDELRARAKAIRQAKLAQSN